MIFKFELKENMKREVNKKMGKIIQKTDIEAKEGYLYYCGRYEKDGKTLVSIGEAKMSRGGKKKKKKTTKKVKKK